VPIVSSKPTLTRLPDEEGITVLALLSWCTAYAKFKPRKGEKTSIPYRDQITRVSLWFANQARITKAKGYLLEFTTRVVLRRRFI
jgi:hypothetical protein